VRGRERVMIAARASAWGVAVYLLASCHLVGPVGDFFFGVAGEGGAVEDLGKVVSWFWPSVGTGILLLGEGGRRIWKWQKHKKRRKNG